MIVSMSRLLALAVVLATALAGGVAPAMGQPRPGVAAPDVTGGPWINSRPLTLAELRGRVVLVEFWTYG
jgi:hypothetical protein